MKIIKLTAFIMAFTVSCGVISTVNNYSSVGFAASAEEDQTGKTVFFDEKTGTLTLKGNLSASDVAEYRKSDVKAVIAEEGTVFPENCSDLFYDFSSETFDLSKADTSNVRSMNGMFFFCKSLTSLDLSGFDTSKVEDMGKMFYGCEKLKSINLSDFDTSLVDNMSKMFYGCTKLESLDLSSFDTSNATGMSEMFSECFSLKTLDLSKMDTSKVMRMERMFYGCDHLETLDLSGFNTINVYRMSEMFGECFKLKTIYVGGKWITDGVEEHNKMFRECYELEGGNGTKYDEEKTSIEYAHVDEKDNPGYFSVREGVSYEIPDYLKNTLVTDGVLTYRVFEDHAEILRCDKDAEGEIVIPGEINGKAVTKIGSNSFYECSKISSVIINDSVKEIGAAAFWACRDLRNVVFPKSLELIDGGAFWNCNLREIDLPDTVKEIDIEAFCGCSIDDVIIPASVEKINRKAFESPRSLTILNPQCDIYDAVGSFTSLRKIYGYKGSTAESYAKKNEVMFIALDNVWGISIMRNMGRNAFQIHICIYNSFVLMH